MAARNLTAEALTPEQLDQLADVSATDVQSAQAAWKRDAPLRFRNLLDATPVAAEEDEEL